MTVIQETIHRLLHLTAWDWVGMFGEGLFMSRFIVQWLATEKHRKVTVPTLFWYLSILGTLVVLVYSFHVTNPVFALASLLQLGIYFRNLYFIHRKPPEQQQPATPDA